MDIEGFRSKLLKYLPNFYNDDKFSDFEFLLNGGEKRKGHKFLLFLRCGGWNIENLDSVSLLDLSDYGRTTSEVFIKWIYTGAIRTIDKAVWEELLRMSVSLNVSSLFERCKAVLEIKNNDTRIDTAESKSDARQHTHPATGVVKPERKSQRLTTAAKQNTAKSWTPRMQHCQLCQKNFTSQFRLKRHLQSLDHKRKVKNLDKTVGANSDKCNACSKRKQEDCNLDKDVGANSNKCDVCDKRKLEDCHLDNTVGANSDKCDACSKRKLVDCHLDKTVGANICDCSVRLLDSEPDLEQQLFQRNSEKCNGQKPVQTQEVYTSDFCSKPCTGKNDHEIHDSKAAYEFCHKEFFNDEKIKKHSATHNKVKVLKCDVCSKVFKTAQNLNRHLRLHTGEKPYLCSHCGQGFIQFTQLQVHLRGHSGERPYHCGHCDKTFASKFIYNQHLDIHSSTGQKKYICDVCGLGFNRQSNCRRHIQLHTDSKPFKCDVCSKAYSTKHALKTHIKHQTLSAKSCRNSGLIPPVSMATVSVTLSDSLSIIPPLISNTFINVQTLPEK